MNLYQERLLSYYKDKRYVGTLEHPTFCSAQYNPSCGDRVQVCARLEGGIVSAMKYEGVGCVISQAAAALLCEYAIGKSWQEISVVDAAKMQELLQISLGPNRLRCATLVLEALKQGLSTL